MASNEKEGDYVGKNTKTAEKIQAEKWVVAAAVDII